MLIEQSEGTVYGCRYYTVKTLTFDTGWYHQDWHDMENWCKKTYGPTPEDGVWTPGARWYVNNAKFWFRDLADITLFMLRWS
jgi:hypothetical protein